MPSGFAPGIMGEIVNCDYANVRTKVGSKEYIVVKGNQLKVGSKVQLLAYENGRYKISYKGQDGYVYKDYVKF